MIQNTIIFNNSDVGIDFANIDGNDIMKKLIIPNWERFNANLILIIDWNDGRILCHKTRHFPKDSIFKLNCLNEIIRLHTTEGYTDEHIDRVNKLKQKII